MIDDSFIAEVRSDMLRFAQLQLRDSALAVIETRPPGLSAAQLTDPENAAPVVEKVTRAVPPRLSATLSADWSPQPCP